VQQGPVTVCHDLAAPASVTYPASDSDGGYTVTWPAVSHATAYRLEEAVNSGFTGATVVYDGPSTSCSLSGRPSGTYYYRVRAYSACATGSWRNGGALVVTLPSDTDQDGIPDTLETASCTDPGDADTDDDGIPDGVEDENHNGARDSGETHPCLEDSDGDGIQDGTESGYTEGDIGPGTDTGVFIPDADPSSSTDPLDPDSDGDNVRDGDEDTNRNGRVDAGERDPGARERGMPWILLLLGN
jgi:hypothetical protein